MTENGPVCMGWVGVALAVLGVENGLKCDFSKDMYEWPLRALSPAPALLILNRAVYFARIYVHAAKTLPNNSRKLNEGIAVSPLSRFNLFAVFKMITAARLRRLRTRGGAVQPLAKPARGRLRCEVILCVRALFWISMQLTCRNFAEFQKTALWKAHVSTYLSKARRFAYRTQPNA